MIDELPTIDTGSRAGSASGIVSGQLGTIVSWKCPATVGLGELRLALTSAGLEAGLAADLSNLNALSRALREMKKKRVIRRFKKEADVIKFQINQTVEGSQIEYPYEDTVELDTKTGDVSAHDSALATQARELLNEHLDKRLTSDLTRLVQRIFVARQGDLIPIREQGGCYFVPAAHNDLVDAVRSVLKDIGGSVRSFEVRLGSDDTSASVADNMLEYFSGLIQEFRDSCKDVCGDSRKDVKARRQEKVGELRQKLNCYRGLLLGFAGNIDREIDAAEEELLKQLLASADGSAADGSLVGSGA